MKHQRLISTSLLSLHLHHHGYRLNLILMHVYTHFYMCGGAKWLQIYSQMASVPPGTTVGLQRSALSVILPSPVVESR